MNDKKMPEGLSIGQIFWRVEVEDKDISAGLKEILEEMKREKKLLKLNPSLRKSIKTLNKSRLLYGEYRPNLPKHIHK